MKIIIIEDEQYAAKGLERMLLKLRPDLEVVRKITGVEEGIQYFEDHPEPDLLFCDIQLSDGDVFEIFKKHPVQCPVVFTTAFDEYALQAFEVNSINYLLKPIKIKEVQQALNKFDAHYKPSVMDFEELQKMLNKPTYKARFIGKIGQNIQIIPVENIAYFLSEDGVTFLFTTKGKRLIVDYTLEQLSNLLDPAHFFRANRQLVPHIQSIQKVEPYFKGRLFLNLQPEIDSKQTISQNKAQDFKEWLEQ